jgi:hypothetical protein
MKKLSFIICLFIAVSGITNKVQAQYYFYNDNYYYSPVMYEIGASIGAMNSLTDIGGKAGIGKKFTKDLNGQNTAVSYGAYFGVTYRNAIAARLEGCFGKVSANDNILAAIPNSDIAKARYNRNLNFESSISEFSLLAEVHPLFIFFNWEESENGPPRYSPYLLGGIGYFSFNPQANLDGKLVDLQPLSTEGQGFKEYPDRPVYKLKQFNFPIGLGFKYELSDMLNLRAEFVYRILNTDYLDDVSTSYIDPTAFAANGFTGTKLANALKLHDRQITKVAGPEGKRGSPTQNDSYFTFNLKIGLNIGRQRID